MIAFRRSPRRKLIAGAALVPLSFLFQKQTKNGRMRDEKVFLR